jgi:hypothetical protein
VELGVAAQAVDVQRWARLPSERADDRRQRRLVEGCAGGDHPPAEVPPSTDSGELGVEVMGEVLSFTEDQDREPANVDRVAGSVGDRVPRYQSELIAPPKRSTTEMCTPSATAPATAHSNSRPGVRGTLSTAGATMRKMTSGPEADGKDKADKPTPPVDAATSPVPHRG